MYTASSHTVHLAGIICVLWLDFVSCSDDGLSSLAATLLLCQSTLQLTDCACLLPQICYPCMWKGGSHRVQG